MQRSDLFRSFVEIRDALDNAIPLEQKHPGKSWAMNLRHSPMKKNEPIDTYQPVGPAHNAIFAKVIESNNKRINMSKYSSERPASHLVMSNDSLFLLKQNNKQVAHLRRKVINN